MAVGATTALLLALAQPAGAEPDLADRFSPASNPGFLTGPNQGDPVDIAMSFLRAHPSSYGVSAADLSELAVLSSFTSQHNGVTHVNLIQQHQQLDVFGAAATVNLAADGSVIFVGGSLAAGIGAEATGDADLDAVGAVAAAAEELDLDQPRNLRVMSRRAGPSQETTVSGGGISDAPIPAKLGWQPTPQGLRLAWQLVIDDSSDSHLWNATIDAETGQLLQVDDWTSHDNADEVAERIASTGLTSPAAATRLMSNVLGGSPNSVDDGSSYRVFALPFESPNDGPRTLVTNPADATASPFGWHDTDGVPGAEFTVTRGNNVHAYQEVDANNQPDFDGSPDGGPGLTFDFPLDLNEHPQNYRDAATTNLFYWNNIIHDVTYLYGFDEVSGNFQANNYGRGGGQGDYVRAEAADGAGTNNANFSTPAADAGTPRMQMFLWPGNQFGGQNQVVVDGVGSFDAGWARFTPAPTVAGLPGRTLVYADTGCDASLYPDLLPSDWIAVVDGGTAACSFLQRVQIAEALGADGVVVAHNAAGNVPILGGAGSAAGPRPTIPAAVVNQADGETIKAAIADGDDTGDLRKHPSHPGIIDGDLDAGVVIHEYGHGISLRLTGGPGINCLTGNEQMGEGWSDYFAITMLLDPDVDNPERRGMGTYVLHQSDREGNGIRPRPYSRDMDLQPFTYDSIRTNAWLPNADNQPTSLAIPHGIGHAWAAVLWDVTWDLIDKHGFNPNVYAPWHTGGNNLALQLVIDGLKMQGCGPGFVVGRDAIIAADAALTGGENACTLWASFARRGLGFSAVQGTTNRNDNTEAFDTHPACRSDFLNRTAQPALNTLNAGSAAPLRFHLGANLGLDILAANALAPYSRQVDCDTLTVPSTNPPFVTPRATPVAATSPGNSPPLTVNGNGRYQYLWKTDDAWAGSCREFVLTLDNGHQYRAYFQFS